MASRRKGRIIAFQALYFWESSSADGNKIPLEELLCFNWLADPTVSDSKIDVSKTDEGMAAFSKIITAGTIENIDKIDTIIKNHLENWDITRVNRVDLAVLRISVFMLMFQKDISPSIIIDEAIGICMEFGTDDSFKFVNGVLDSIRKTLQEKLKS